MADPAGHGTRVVYASVSSRLLAYAADAALLTGFLYIAAIVLNAVRGPVVRFQTGPGTAGSWLAVDHGRVLAVAIISASLSAIYFIGSWTARPATPGQHLLGIAVGSAPGRSLTIGQAFARWLLLMGPLSLGALVASVLPGVRPSLVAVTLAWHLLLVVTTVRSPTRRGLHDRWAGSVVTTGGRTERPTAAS